MSPEIFIIQFVCAQHPPPILLLTVHEYICWMNKPLYETCTILPQNLFNQSLFLFFPGTSLVAQTVKRLSTMWETWVQFLGWEDPLEKEMAIHSSTIAWKIPWTEEPGRLQSMGSKESDTTERLHFHFLFFFSCGPTFLFGLTQPLCSLMCGYVFPCLFISARWWTPWRWERGFPKEGLCQLLTQ